MVFLLLYIRTDPITLPHSLARAGNYGINVTDFLYILSIIFATPVNCFLQNLEKKIKVDIRLISLFGSKKV